MICMFKAVHYCQLMYLRNFGTCTRFSMKSSLKKVKLCLSTDINAINGIKGIQDGICHAMKDYDKNKESSYLRYLNVNNLYGQAMAKKFPLVAFKWDENASHFSKDSNEGYW